MFSRIGSDDNLMHTLRRNSLNGKTYEGDIVPALGNPMIPSVGAKGRNVRELGRRGREQDWVPLHIDGRISNHGVFEDSHWGEAIRATAAR